MEHTVKAQITPEIFQEFAWFDMLRQQKRYRMPGIFFLIMAAFAGVCFLAGNGIRGAGLLGGVLLGVGLVLPLGWLLSFHLSIRAESKRLKLAQAPVAYTLHLTGKGLTVTTEREKAEYPWEQLYCACRLRRCICLYAGPRRAFLLPAKAGQDGDRIWGEICGYLAEGKARDYSGRAAS